MHIIGDYVSLLLSKDTARTGRKTLRRTAGDSLNEPKGQ